jgi:hypothetical protein
MPLFNSQHQNDRGIRWRGIAATAMVELLVLFALSFAVVRYVEWSSAANQAEFVMRSERVELLTPSGSPATAFNAQVLVEVLRRGRRAEIKCEFGAFDVSACHTMVARRLLV